MSTITGKDGTTIYYKDRGAGPVVTFSHGWTGNLKAVMGHRDVKTAMKYQHPELEVVRAALDQSSKTSEVERVEKNLRNTLRHTYKLAPR